MGEEAQRPTYLRCSNEGKPDWDVNIVVTLQIAARMVKSVRFLALVL